MTGDTEDQQWISRDLCNEEVECTSDLTDAGDIIFEGGVYREIGKEQSNVTETLRDLTHLNKLIQQSRASYDQLLNISYQIQKHDKTNKDCKKDVINTDCEAKCGKSRRKVSPYSCSVCHKTFRIRRNFEAHERIHSGERPFECSVCNKTFSQSGHLKYHERTHSGERPHTCSVCHKTFSQSSSLKSHERIHSGERPYACTVCNKTFAQSSGLTRHMRIHSGERPFTCSVCNKTFSQSSHLNDHQRIHSGQRPYACCICTKTFSQSSALKLHERTHIMQQSLFATSNVQN